MDPVIIARSIVRDGMNADDRAGYDRDEWREGVGNMLVDDCAGVDLEAVLDAIEEEIEDKFREERTGMESAYEWGMHHCCCREALEMRGQLGDGTQADWWQVCPYGDWLLWQWWQLPKNVRSRTQPLVMHAVTERIVLRALRRAQDALEDNHAPWACEWRRWAQRWLACEDRSADAAETAAAAAKNSGAVCAAEAAAAVGAVKTPIGDVAAIWAAEAAVAAAVEADADADAGVEDAAADAAEAADAERRSQADDIRRYLPDWPGSEA
ncbi:MAG: hypothetical protein ACE5F6_00485 [Anaerolineae bacterium]